ncbi:MAG TPA: MoaD/ThiS family protein [Anaerolineales bacterium]|nr:MoaD/ThiS family protein [Anaerolineales bacterium]
MIHVDIRLHGILRDRLPAADRGETTLTLPDGATAQAVLDRFDLNGIVSIAVNDEIELHPDHPLTDGDRVELFRVAGGG